MAGGSLLLWTTTGSSLENARLTLGIVCEAVAGLAQRPSTGRGQRRSPGADA
jgi:hypothetical protein